MPGTAVSLAVSRDLSTKHAAARVHERHDGRYSSVVTQHTVPSVVAAVQSFHPPQGREA